MSYVIKTQALGMGTSLGRHKPTTKKVKRIVKPKTEDDPKPIATTLRKDGLHGDLDVNG